MNSTKLFQGKRSKWPQKKKHMRKCSPFLPIKEMPIKTRLRFHLTPVRMAIKYTILNFGEDVEKKEPS
jgi:hypothetical protein